MESPGTAASERVITYFNRQYAVSQKEKYRNPERDCT